MYQAWGMRRETGENKIVTYPFPTVWFWHDPLSAQATAGGVGSAGSHPPGPNPRLRSIPTGRASPPKIKQPHLAPMQTSVLRQRPGEKANHGLRMASSWGWVGVRGAQGANEISHPVILTREGCTSAREWRSPRERVYVWDFRAAGYEARLSGCSEGTDATFPPLSRLPPVWPRI